MDATIKTMDQTYSERLAAAMKAAKCSTSGLSDALGISYQAVKKVLDGKSASLTAENNAKAAKHLKASSDWLATGEGQMTIPSLTTPNIKFSLPAEDEADIVAALRVLDDHLKGLSPVLVDAGREVLRKWATGVASIDEVANALEAMALASETMQKKAD